VTLEALWEEHQQSPFPRAHLGGDIADLAELDATIAGSIAYALEAGRPLDQKRLAILRDSQAELSRRLPTIPRTAQSYFVRLLDMADKLANDSPP
jgi:hypothetical protein